MVPSQTGANREDNLPASLILLDMELNHAVFTADFLQLINIYLS